LLQKISMGLCKSYSWKKEKRESWEKNEQVSEISKIMGTSMPAWKKKEEKERWIR
jgi:hypothetical protein